MVLLFHYIILSKLLKSGAILLLLAVLQNIVVSPTYPSAYQCRANNRLHCFILWSDYLCDAPSPTQYHKIQMYGLPCIVVSRITAYHPPPSPCRMHSIAITLWIALLLEVVPKAIPIHTHPSWWPFQYPESCDKFIVMIATKNCDEKPQKVDGI